MTGITLATSPSPELRLPLLTNTIPPAMKGLERVGSDYVNEDAGPGEAVVWNSSMVAAILGVASVEEE